jgi:ABC-type dipeptide/oligopeptide/nickel transport system permease subunit
MIGLFQSYITTKWHLTVFPALLLAITMLLWYQFGEGLRAAMDPSVRI